MYTFTPADVVSFFADEDARVKDEVQRISSLLTERLPGSNRPKHIIGGCFVLKIEASADVTFMKKVAEVFEEMAVGWIAEIVSRNDICGQYKQFVLSHESFSTLPHHVQDFDCIPD